MKSLDNIIDDASSTISQESNTATTPLPNSELFLIWIVHASQAFQTTMLFPMLVFMVEKYGGATRISAQAVGWHAGLLASLFPLAQCCSSVVWGIISDRTGRKPSLAFGCATSAVSAILLGFCSTYTSACFVRFLAGLLNGTLTVTKSVVSELCDGSNLAKGFGLLNLAWGIGAMMGPVVSGLLAQPCVQYKLQHCPDFLVKYPFLLPCIGAAIFSVAGTIASLSLIETNPRYHKASGYDQLPRQDVSTMDSDKLAEDEPKCSEMVQLTCMDEDQVMNTAGCKQKLIVVISTSGKSETNHIVTPEEGGDDSCCRTQGTVSVGKETWDKAPSRFAWLNRDVLLVSLCYSMTGFIFIITDELFPIFGAASSSVGGLGFSSFALGLILGEGGVVLCLYTLLLYPKVCQLLGPLKCFRLGILTSIPLWYIFPISSLFPTVPVVQWSLLLLSMAARGAASCSAFAGVLILVSNSASQEHIGAVTGLSSSFCSLFRAVGPACGGMIWSFASGQKFPLHQFLVWQFVVFLSIFTVGLSYLLPPSLSKPKIDNLRLDKCLH
ncbi:hypothetical protein BDL97_03G110700 [Sphagnum fallax]|nr:hypothetical protein BDL97_03G110700 [Sphagnum fallax]KAH8968084.1 hypothetical protein BDL97_03G110700 [Sphagnum fallax]